MQVESALFFETIEQIYLRVFRSVKPRTPLTGVRVEYRRYANANSRIRLEDGILAVDISDVLKDAPAPIQEALAAILISKLFRRTPDNSVLARYRRYLNRPEVRRSLHAVQQERGRKLILDPAGHVYDLCALFEELNLAYFHGLMARPRLGWSRRRSRSILGHYDPSHHTIVLSRILDSPVAPELVVRYVLFHEMLHLRYPTEHRGARRSVHTREFKAAEREFRDYDDAQRALKRFLGETPRELD
ncbi:MAG TPA: SprT-like domain-containing protein [Bryobacteraceae bacterium]|jgi:hypothetical protein